MTGPCQIDRAMSNRCVPGPINTCSVTWRDLGVDNPQNRLLADVSLHPTGGLQEICDGDQVGVAVCLRDGNEVTEPAPNQPASLAVDPDGKLYAPLPPRKRKRLPSASAEISPGSTSAPYSLIDDTSIQLDNFGSTTEACWEICIDVCSARVNYPTGGNWQVTIPPTTATDGQSHTHGGTVTVTEPPRTSAELELDINGWRCTIVTAERDSGSYVGRVCTDVTVPANSLLALPVRVDARWASAVDEPFFASSGDMIVTCTPVSCSEEC